MKFNAMANKVFVEYMYILAENLVHERYHTHFICTCQAKDVLQ